MSRPTVLQLRGDERYDMQTGRKAGDPGNAEGIVPISTVEEMAQVVSTYAGQLRGFFQQTPARGRSGGEIRASGGG